MICKDKVHALVGYEILSKIPLLEIDTISLTLEVGLRLLLSSDRILYKGS